MIKKLGVLILLLIAVFIISYFHTINKTSIEEDKSFVVNQGETVEEVASNLKKQEILEKENFFSFYVKANELGNKIKAGKYTIKGGSSIKNIVNLLISNQARKQEVTVKIIEGWTLKDISKYLENEGYFSQEEFYQEVGYPKNFKKTANLKIDKKYSKDYDFLASKPKNQTLEGYLFPDTYRMYENFKPEDLVRKMLNNFSNKLNSELRQEIQDQHKTIYEIVTMASVLEKEVGIDEEARDARIVAGIFYNRINSSQPLQSCASLAYILEENKQQYSTRDTKIESPYNTYKYTGLPIGPISNPGLGAITAAIYPIETNYNYFLSPLGSDKTIFSVSYQEHIQNKNKYLK